MLFETLAAKKFAEAIPWRIVITVAIALAIVAGAWFTVRAYNGAIREADAAKASLKAAQEELRQERATTARLQQNLAELRTYYSARETRQQQATSRRSQVLARKEKTDEKGNIATDDPTLTDLNRLFPGGQDGDGEADHPDAAGLPAAAPGPVRPGG